MRSTWTAKSHVVIGGRVSANVFLFASMQWMKESLLLRFNTWDETEVNGWPVNQGHAGLKGHYEDGRIGFDGANVEKQKSLRDEWQPCQRPIFRQDLWVSLTDWDILSSKTALRSQVFEETKKVSNCSFAALIDLWEFRDKDEMTFFVVVKEVQQICCTIVQVIASVKSDREREGERREKILSAFGERLFASEHEIERRIFSGTILS